MNSHDISYYFLMTRDSQQIPTKKHGVNCVVLWKHPFFPGLVLEDLAGKETVRQSTMREVLQDTSGAINAAETWIFFVNIFSDLYALKFPARNGRALCPSTMGQWVQPLQGKFKGDVIRMVCWFVA